MSIISVSELNVYIKTYIEQNTKLTDLWISGEISGIKHHHSGHLYITLKDEQSVLRAVMFKTGAQKLKFTPVCGMKVISFGRISMYEREGCYQLIVEKMVPDGVGELYVSFEQLKLSLQKKGLFSIEHKKSLPEFPKKIGIVTSISGAAIRDIISVTGRRYPVAELIVYPAFVQGENACISICNGIDFLDNKTDCDVIILARGGGSSEDLWVFNDEKIAYAVFNCSKPVISAIGHETDYTISDYVADVRAPTPSAAAEIVVPSADELNKHIIACQKKLNFILKKKLDSYLATSHRLNRFDFSKKEYDLLNKKKELINSLTYRLECSINQIYRKWCERIAFSESILNNFNPDNVLKLGYALICDRSDKIALPCELQPDDLINIKFHNARLKCIVKEIVYDKQ